MPETCVRDFMTRDPLTIKQSARLREAVELVMVRRIRHIPVLDEEGRLAGIVTDRDVKRSLPSPLSAIASEEYESILDDTPVSRVMTREPLTIEASAQIAEGVETLLNGKVGGLPVIENQRLIGIFTERDALRGYLKLLRRLGGLPGESSAAS
jgi:CBS domain-containing protein